MRRLLARWRCRRGHRWFPGPSSREFIPEVSVCLRPGCDARMVSLPWGECFSGHPIVEHYDVAGELVSHPTCTAGPW